MDYQNLVQSKEQLEEALGKVQEHIAYFRVNGDPTGKQIPNYKIVEKELADKISECDFNIQAFYNGTPYSNDQWGTAYSNAFTINTGVLYT